MKKFTRRRLLEKLALTAAGGLLTACKPLLVIEFKPQTPVPAGEGATPTAIHVNPPTPSAEPTAAPTSQPTVEVMQTREEFLVAHEVKKGDTSRKVVMMTYDDVATYVQVSQILAAFRAYPNCKATFFFLGNKIEPSSKVVRAIQADGHLIGCHGWDHEALSRKTDAAINKDFERCFTAINNVLPGYRFEFIRFPFGDSVGSPRVLKIAACWGMQHVYWSMQSNGTIKDTFNIVTSNVEPGAIVLSHMHRKYDIEQAGRIVDRLLELGYSLETVRTGRSLQDVYPEDRPMLFG